ncbi:MAG TPA: ABC transporter permease [Puia sp.]|nr:ABC transporter permease [Puia sp.]
MIGNYIKIAYRSLKRNKLISFINIFGLGLSMSVGMMELVILQDELSYDRFHPFPDRTFRVISSYHKKTGEQWTLASTPLPLYDLLKTDTADIAQTVNLYPVLNGAAHWGSKELTLRGAFTESSFFNIFGFRLAAGDPATALKDPNGMVLSKSTATKFFGTADPMGKTIRLDHRGNFIVTGVLADNPGKSHIDFDAYSSISAVPQLVLNKELPDRRNEWGDCRVAYTYVLLKPGAGKTTLNGQINAIAAAVNRYDKNGQLSFLTQPIEKIRPAPDNIYNDIGRGTSWSKLWTGIIVSLLLLFAACFNYTNLTVARALTRAKEVGIRKISGAKRHQIFTQYIVEACLLAFVASGFAWILLSFIIRYAPFNDGYEMIPSSFRYNLPYFLYTLGFTLFAGLVAGIAPAWILSAFRPLRVLKNLSTAKIFGKIGLQKTLIVFQYSLSLVIIIFLFAFYRQFSFMAAADHGFKRDNVLVVPLNGADEKIAAQTIAATSGVQSVSGLSTSFTPHYNGMRGPGWIDNSQKGSLTLNYFFADRHFIPDMKIGLLAGRNFTDGTDTASEQTVIINAKASRILGFKEPEKALGNKLWVNDSTSLQIVGVVNDFEYENAGKPIDPMAFRNKKGSYNYLFISVDPSDKQSVTDRIARIWKTLAPSQTFTSSWLDDDLENNDTPRTTISLLGYLAFMTVSIASLGLLGLVIYSVEIKRKEISIRKVIGASQQQVVSLLSKGFVKLLLIAGAIGVPIGYTLSFLFQLNFLSRAGYGLPAAVLCFIFLLSLGLITIISQTWKASLENPAKSLKVE